MNSKKVFITGDKLMHKMHLRQPGFIYSACGPFPKKQKSNTKIKKKPEHSWYIYQNELDKVCKLVEILKIIWMNRFW